MFYPGFPAVMPPDFVPANKKPFLGPTLDDLPNMLQCGMCGQPVAPQKGKFWTPTPNLDHKCPGPSPLDMSDSPCIGPCFDPCAAAGMTNYCCICLRECEIDDPARMKTQVDSISGKYVTYDRNKDQLHWSHKSAEL